MMEVYHEKIFFTLLVACLAISMSACGSRAKKTTTATTEESTEVVETTYVTSVGTTVALTEDELIKKTVYDAFGEDNIISYEYSEDPKTFYVTALAEDDLTNSIIRTGIENEIRTTLQTLQDIEGLNASFAIQFPFVDVTGSPSLSSGRLIRFRRRGSSFVLEWRASFFTASSRSLPLL